MTILELKTGLSLTTYACRLCGEDVKAVLTPIDGLCQECHELYSDIDDRPHIARKILRELEQNG